MKLFITDNRPHGSISAYVESEQPERYTQTLVLDEPVDLWFLWQCCESDSNELQDTALAVEKYLACREALLWSDVISSDQVAADNHWTSIPASKPDDIERHGLELVEIVRECFGERAADKQAAALGLFAVTY